MNINSTPASHSSSNSSISSYSESSYKRIHSQPAYILHSSAYQNTSLLVDAFTANYGRIRFVAKGAKRFKSAFAGKLQVFTPLHISWSGRGDLYTLTEADFAGFKQCSFAASVLRGTTLLSAYYINELVLRFLTLEDPHTELFYYYVDTLTKLQTKQGIESVLRSFEKNLLNEVGYSLLLSHDSDSGENIQAEKQYYYVLSEGPKQVYTDIAKNNADGIYISGQSLLELDRGLFTTSESLKQAKQLMRVIIAKYLGDVPLKTRALFQSTIL